MIKIDTEEQAAQITDEQLKDVDFDYLLTTYQRLEFDSIPNSLFIVLMCMMGLKKNGRRFTLSWLIENVRTPDYAYFKDDQQVDGDLFYLFTGGQLVGHVRIRNNAFDGFGTVEREHFNTVCLPLDTWQEAVKKKRRE